MLVALLKEVGGWSKRGVFNFPSANHSDTGFEREGIGRGHAFARANNLVVLVLVHRDGEAVRRFLPRQFDKVPAYRIHVFAVIKIAFFLSASNLVGVEVGKAVGLEVSAPVPRKFSRPYFSVKISADTQDARIAIAIALINVRLSYSQCSYSSVTILRPGHAEMPRRSVNTAVRAGAEPIQQVPA